MKIKNIKINSFGKLKDKEINLQNNINIIYGKNESGKSTLLKFISSIFYGIQKNKNGKEISDFDQYLPWSENDFSGKISYELDNGEQYEIFRDFRKKNPKIYNNKLEDISNNYSIDKTKGNSFFKEQTGIEEELFYSTILAEQDRTKLDEKEQNVLLQKMTNLVSTGDDSISYKRTQEKLKSKLLEEVGTDRTTDRPINKIEEKLAKLNIEYASTKKLTERQEELSILERQKKEQVDKYNNYVKALTEIKQKKQEENLENEFVKIGNEEIKNLEKKLNSKKLEIENQNQKNKNKKNNKIKKIIPELFLIIFITINIILFLFNKNKIINYIFLFLSIIYFIFYITKKIKTNKYNKKIKEEEIKNKKEIELLEENINSKNTEINSRITAINKKMENNKLKIKNYFPNIYLENEFEKNQNEIENDLKDEEGKNNKLKFELHEIEIEKKNNNIKLEKIPELEYEINSTKTEMEELISHANSINIAKQILEEAYNEMKDNLTPKFTNDLTEIAKNISSNKYNKIKFSDQEGLVVEIKNGEYKKVERLSTGTVLQMYLALRLSIAKEITNENMPIFLDEAFAYYDDERLKNILLYLNENFKNNQIFIFTCSMREKEILQKNNIKFEFIEM